ncbi:hypothetical protein Tco_0037703 [Tanacetum coccineum]
MGSVIVFGRRGSVELDRCSVLLWLFEVGIVVLGCSGVGFFVVRVGRIFLVVSVSGSCLWCVYEVVAGGCGFGGWVGEFLGGVRWCYGCTVMFRGSLCAVDLVWGVKGDGVGFLVRSGIVVSSVGYRSVVGSLVLDLVPHAKVRGAQLVGGDMVVVREEGEDLGEWGCTQSRDLGGVVTGGVAC